jgi:hypothetical protein
MEDLKLWLKRQIEILNSDTEFDKGTKWGFECVIKKIERMQPNYCCECGECEVNEDNWWCILNGKDVTGNEACDEFKHE